MRTEGVSRRRVGDQDSGSPGLGVVSRDMAEREYISIDGNDIRCVIVGGGGSALCENTSLAVMSGRWYSR